MWYPRLTSAAFAGILSLAACGGTDQATDIDQTIDTTAPSDAAPTRLDIDAILLRVDDLPAGWSKVPATNDEDGSCLDGLFASGGPFDPDGAANAAFGASDIGPFLAAWVVDRPTSDVLAEVNDVLVSCDGTTGMSGFTTTIDPTPVAGIPDESLSVHGVDENASGSRINFAVAGAGTDEATVFVFIATPLGEIDDEVLADAVNAMADRIPPS